MNKEIKLITSKYILNSTWFEDSTSDCSGSKSYGLWRHVGGWYFPDVSKQPTSVIVMVAVNSRSRKTEDHLTTNDDYSFRTAPLTPKLCILYIYSTHTGAEYFKHGIYSPFFPLQNAVCFIILTYLVPVLFTFYIQNVLKLKKIIPAPKG